MKAPGQLIDQSTRHAAHLERLKTQNVNDVIEVLGDINSQLIAFIARTDIDRLTRIQAEKQIKAFNKIAKGRYTEDIFTLLDQQIEELATYEAGFEIKSLSQGIKHDFILLKTAQLVTAINSTPLNLGGRYQGSLLGGLAESFTTAQTRLLGNTIRNSYASGMTTADTITALQKEAFPINSSDLNAVVRTSLQHAATQTRVETWQQNDDIVRGIQIIATLDGGTSVECRARDGQILSLKSENLPPYHYNAVMEGQMITTINGKVPIENVCVGDLVLTHKGRWKKVLTVMRKLNDTNFVRAIHFDSGRILKVTDEHPVLIDGIGWTRADTVKIGDQLFENIKNKFKFSLRPSIIKSNPKNYPSLFDGCEVFFEVSSEPSTMASTIDFNSDFILRESKISNATTSDKLVNKTSNTTNIKVVFKEFFTKNKRLSMSFKMAFQNFFSMCANRVVFFHPVRMIFVDFRGFFGHTKSPMVFASIHSLFGSYFPGDGRSLGTAKWLNTVFSTPSGHSAISKFKFSLDSPQRLLSCVVMSVKKFYKILFVCKFNHFKPSIVSDITSVAHNGYVYNLEVEEDNTYIASGIVVHNCRTTTAAALDRSFDFLNRGETRASRNPETGKIESVPAKQTYYTWLKNQPKAFQESVIGVKRTKLLRNGGLSSERFAELQLGKSFEPLTLKQMRELDPVAFSKADIQL